MSSEVLEEMKEHFTDEELAAIVDACGGEVIYFPYFDSYLSRMDIPAEEKKKLLREAVRDLGLRTSQRPRKATAAPDVPQDALALFK